MTLPGLHIDSIQELFDALNKEAKEIQSFTEITMSEDMNEVVYRGNALQVYIARTGAMLAEAEYVLNFRLETAVMSAIAEIMEANKLSAGVQNALVASRLKEERKLVKTIERLNRTVTHQSEWCRSVLSKCREEMRLTNYLPN